MNWERNLRTIEPYVPGEQPDFADMIKLNTNENPYPPAPGVVEAMKNFDIDRMRLYPPVDAGVLGKVIAEYHHISQDRLFVGVGSDDVLAVAFLTCFNSDKPILFPDITYSFYDVWANLYNIPFTRIPLDDEFRINREDYITPNGGIVIANPNAPTSILEPVENIEYIIKNNPDSVVIVDEAYVDFGGDTALELVDKYENLLVVRTFSKSRSMAGMRIGYAIGSKRLIGAMNDVKFSINSYTMNQTSIVYGAESIKDESYFRETIDKIVNTRERSTAELKKLGFKVLPSSTNFLFASHERVPAVQIFEQLKKKNIFVRYFNKARIDNYLRITIGTDTQMDKLISELSTILK